MSKIISYSELICDKRQHFITSQSLSVVADFIKIRQWQDEGVSEVTARRLLAFYLDKQYPEAIYLSAFVPALAGPDTGREAWFYQQIESAADLAYPTAMYHYGAYLDLGEYFTQDKRRASQLFQRAADCGHAHSQWLHGIELLYGTGSYAADRERGLMYIQCSAQKKFIAALESLAKFY